MVAYSPRLSLPRDPADLETCDEPKNSHLRPGESRRQFTIVLLCLFAISAKHCSCVGAWKEIPSITVVSTENDSRLPAVREAVGFWNATFSKLGSPFRLGAITHTVGMIPVGDLYALRGSFSAK